MFIIIHVERGSIRASLGAGPEGRSFLGLGIWGEHTKQVSNLVIEVRVEIIASNLHAAVVISVNLKVHDVSDLLQFVKSAGRSGILLQVLEEAIRIFDEVNSVLHSVHKDLIE